MGASNSTQLGSTSGSISSGVTPSQDSLEMANSWTSLSDSGHGTQGTTTDGSYTNIVPPKEKKRKNLSSLATLRKRLVRRRRTSKCFDHNQIMRDFISSWTTRDIKQLCEEYECSGLLKELSLLAESARPLASTTQNYLCELYDFKYCCICCLGFQPICIDWKDL